MAVEDHARGQLQRRLEEVLGTDHARTLMEQLPQQEPATRADLDAAEGRLGARMDGLEARMDGLEARMDRLEERMDRLEERMDRLEERMDDLKERIDLKTESVADRVLGAMHQEIGAVRMDLIAQVRTMMYATVSAIVAVSGLAVAALRWT